MNHRHISMLRPSENSGINFGHSSRLSYDDCAYEDQHEDSIGHFSRHMNPISINNCNGCFTGFGPRAASYGVSTTVGHRTAPKQELVDLETVLSNRNVLASKCRDGRVNDIDVTKFRLQHARTCNDFLDPISSRCTNNASLYRGMSINRFEDLPKNAQTNIFWDWNKNTTLEAKDNYRERVPRMLSADPALPNELKGPGNTCPANCTSNCPTGCGKK
jgi:hypothetical protein